MKRTLTALALILAATSAQAGPPQQSLQWRLSEQSGEIIGVSTLSAGDLSIPLIYVRTETVHRGGTIIHFYECIGTTALADNETLERIGTGNRGKCTHLGGGVQNSKGRGPSNLQ